MSSRWRDDAACAGMDTELWFAADGVRTESPGQQRRVRYARSVCGRCPVRVDCLAYALDTVQIYGMWGGYTERERAALRRSRNADRRERALAR